MYRYDAFDLKISSEGNDLKVIWESPSGPQAQGIVPSFPAKQLLRQFSQLAKVRPWDPDVLEDFGSRLFEALFPGSVYEFYVPTLEELNFKRKKMRLNLWCDEHLAQLPWELAFDTRRRVFLSLDPNLSIVRVWPTSQEEADTAPEQVVRILAVFPSPVDLVPLPRRQEIAFLREALEIPIQRNRVELTIRAEEVTFDRVVQDFSSQLPHVFHFAGHGMLKHQTSGLFFANEKGESLFVDARSLRDFFRERVPRMVCIIAGESASPGAGLFHHGLAFSLLSAGVSVVIGLQGEVTNGSTLRFVRALYSTIADGLSIGNAMREARRAIRMDPSSMNSIDWAMPVVYTNASATDLVLLAPPTSSQEDQPTVRAGQSITNVGGEVITGDSNYINVKQQVHNVEVGKIVGARIKEIDSSRKIERQSESSQVGDEQIQTYISNLKAAILRVATLSTSERINTIALTEKLRFMILEPSHDAEEISKIFKGLSAAGPEVNEVASEFRKLLHL